MATTIEQLTEKFDAFVARNGERRAAAAARLTADTGLVQAQTDAARQIADAQVVADSAHAAETAAETAQQMALDDVRAALADFSVGS